MKKDIIFKQCSAPDKLMPALYTPQIFLAEKKGNPYVLACLKLNFYTARNDTEGAFGIFRADVKYFVQHGKKEYFFKIQTRKPSTETIYTVFEAHLMEEAEKYKKHVIDRVAFLEDLKIKMAMDEQHFSWLQNQYGSEPPKVAPMREYLRPILPKM